MPASRQLAAILFADIAGYTALMQEDESLAMRFRDKLKKKIEEQSAMHSGTIIKFSGDGVLCSFGSAIECIRAATAVQLSMMEEPHVPLRIGIHQGDVIFEDGDVHGDGVNIASRLESLAVPGSILISSKVYDDVKNQKDIQTVSLGKYLLKNVKEPQEVFAVSNAGLEVPIHKTLEGKAVKYKERIAPRRRIAAMAKWVVPVLLIGVVALLFILPMMKRQHARTVLLPAVQKLMNENFRPPTEAFDMAMEAEKYLSKDSSLRRLWPTLATTISIQTEPKGVEVYWKDYVKPGDEWRSAGVTPLKDIRFSRSYLRMKFRKAGYETIEYAGPGTYKRLGPEIDTLVMEPIGKLPQNMVRIPKNSTDMAIVGLEEYADISVDEFLLDKYEVSNRQYKQFVDEGGYANKAYWQFPIVINGKNIPLDSALALFTDRTGRPGPSTWEAGSYPNGEENFPVSGVSWYEAAAYAAYAKKQLPTVFHWGRVAETSRTEFIVPLSNFNGKSTVAVGSLPGYCSFGIYDMAGNVREWCFNASNSDGYHFILGGGFNDPSYAFNDSYMQPGIDRGEANGFRCMKLLEDADASADSMMRPLTIAFRDYRKEKPVDDATFQFYLRQYEYDKTPLNATVDTIINDEFWTAEKISFDAAYNGERMQAYVYLPKNFKPPYQPILFFPGSGDIFSRKFNPRYIQDRIDFVLKSGRALVVPIYKGTHERFDDLKSDLPEETVFYRDHLIMWRKDIGRTIDYLETRSDIQQNKLGFLGWSWGGFMGGIMPAVEKRIRAVVLNVGGMAMQRSLPEADQINFLPRVTQPVLMLNGKYDMYFPVETSQKPMFDLLGSPQQDKQIIIFDSGHLVPRTEFVKETLRWFDKYLGPVK